MRWLFVALNSVLFSLHANVLYASFHVPKALEKDVLFWEDVLSKYKSNECILHDKDDVSVVYGVRVIPVQKSVKQQKVFTDRFRSEVSQVLLQLAQRKDSSGLKSSQRAVFDAVPASWNSPEHFRAASERVRCQQGVRDRFLLSLKRSQIHLPMIRSYIKKYGLPEDLAFLPHLESGFDPIAQSKVGARGLWQLMPTTARQGMKVNRRLDERINPKIATKFALALLLENYQRVGSWPLALTGYNYGINGIRRAVQSLGSNDYMIVRDQHRSKSFGFAAKHFYPSFLAVRNLALRFERGEDILAQSKVRSVSLWAAAEDSVNISP